MDATEQAVADVVAEFENHPTDNGLYPAHRIYLCGQWECSATAKFSGVGKEHRLYSGLNGKLTCHCMKPLTDLDGKTIPYSIVQSICGVGPTCPLEA
jgi:hypothetical protein